MAYKKYIKRGGKTYGPYIYHSKRIGGKVVSEYHGSRKPDYKKILLAIFGAVFLVALILILVFSEREMTGRAVLNPDENYSQNKTLEEETENTNETISQPAPSPISEPASEPILEPTSYQTQTEIYVPELIVSLTEQERAILIEEFGDTLKVKETSGAGFIKVRYELGDYWVEFNYDVDLSEETLELFKDKDMTKWLKDLAKSLSKEPEADGESKEYQTSF